MIVKVNFITPKRGYKTGLGNLHTLKDWINNGKMLDYITQKKKCVSFFDNENIRNDNLKSHKAKIDWYRSHLKLNQKEPQSGIYDVFDGKVQNLNIDFLKNDLKNINQNVWEMIINPGDLAITHNVLNKEQWANIIRDNLAILLNKSKFEAENVNAYFVIHGNTDYPHVHLYWYEKEAKKKFKDSFLKKEHLADFRNNLLMSMTDGDILKRFREVKKEQWEINSNQKVKNLIQNLHSQSWKIAFKEKQRQFKKFLNASFVIAKEIKGLRNISYKRQNEKVKEAVNEIKEFLLSYENDYSESVRKHQKLINEIMLMDFNSQKSKMIMLKELEKELVKFEYETNNKIIKSIRKSMYSLERLEKALDKKKEINNYFKDFNNNLVIKSIHKKLMYIAYKQYHAKDLKELEDIDKYLKVKIF
ncbi:hypothetical protein [Mycoplasmopsis gallinarum]|uniref:hypothetical protein n=1 Tax=Mycoplasmopsis gallinarum TaxID=29557 RepID=UPI000485730B|nr:hypothetical protein [Mycoplasmopsis gallinarum]